MSLDEDIESKKAELAELEALKAKEVEEATKKAEEDAALEGQRKAKLEQLTNDLNTAKASIEPKLGEIKGLEIQIAKIEEEILPQKELISSIEGQMKEISEAL